MSDNEIIAIQRRRAVRIAAMSASIKFAIRDLVRAIAVGDGSGECPTASPAGKRLARTLELKAKELEDLADMVLARYKEIGKKDCKANP